MAGSIEKLIDELNEITEEVNSAFGGLSDAQLNWKPNPDSWSVGQCIDHIITSNRAYDKAFKSVEDGSHSPTIWSRLPVLSSVFGRMIIKAVHPDSVKKNKTFPVFEPASSDVPATIFQDFASAQERLIEFIQFSKDIDAESVKIASPVGNYINLKLSDVFQLLVLHEKRHVAQAKRVMGTEGFPGE